MNWRSLDNGNGNGFLEVFLVFQVKFSEKLVLKLVLKINGFCEEYNYRGNGYIFIIGMSVGFFRVLDWVECWMVG